MLQAVTELSHSLRNAAVCTDLASHFDCDFFFFFKPANRRMDIQNKFLYCFAYVLLVIFPKERVICSVG